MTKKELLKRIIALEKRYATTEEIDLLEPKQKELEVGKWYRFIGHTVEYKPLMLITSISGSTVKFCGFNFIGNWVDNDLYTLEDLNRYGYTEATPQEIECALIEEAKRRYNFGDKIYFKEDCITCELDFKKLYFISGENTLYCSYDNWSGTCLIFNNGKWAEVIKNDDKPKVGDVVKAWYNDSPNEFLIKIADAEDLTIFPNIKVITQQEAIYLLFNNGGN